MSDATGHLPGSRAYRRLLVALFFAGIATFAQLYSPQAVLPLISADLDVSPPTASLAVSATTLGLAAAVIPWSIVADRFGRVPAMTVGICTATVLGLLAPLANDIGVFLGIRLAEGVALGAIPAIALAYLSEEVDARHTASAAGSYIAGTTVGGLSGRLVSGPVADLVEWRAGMWAVAILCAASAVVFLWLVPRARGFIAHRHRPERGLGQRLSALLRTPAQLAIDAQGFLLMGAFVAVFNYLGFHLAEPPFSLPGWLATLLFLSYLAGTVSSPWAGALAVRHGRLPVLLGGISAMLVGLGALLAPATVVVLLGLLVFTAGFFAAHAVASGWAPAAASADTRAQASSLYYLAYYGGSSLFGWCLGFVYAGSGWTAFIGALAAMCAAAAVTAAVALRTAGLAPR
ncbi:putative MFS family arabinose efflux permease [Microbacterium sp. SLBN-154]|uniref:MFS transporter n=1 Tax=Microbacterium sp. SLBN-154 TaxID=2768458 RepID=UPI00114D7E66|nr:MFS transporter [Microbacterium sp. SLBN-154]TQK19391.1 putative MFS family arabinose efflux permease [Microbacterium sp. SLBN-154]